MKRLSYLILIFLLSVTFSSCGGGGSGIDLPPITQSDKIELRADSYIAQTNGSITLEATVSSKGRAVPNVEVTFTNLSPIGNFCNGIKEAITDSSGKAKVCIESTTPGFATIQAEVNKGSGIVRERKTVFFSSNDILAVRLALDVDADNDLIYDELSDTLLGETSSDNSVKIRARVYDAGGVLLAGRLVQFDAERAYRVGTSILGTDSTWPCSDESDTCYIAFPSGNTAYTDEKNGEAITQMLVGVESLRNFTTNLNIFAQADNGASNMKTLFISPVTVSSITVTANPSVIPPSTSGTASTSTITAIAMTNTNQPVPDGTTINFSIDSACAAAGGKITPFGRTGVAASGDGTATATFTAPSASRTCTITAAVGGVSNTTTVTVTTTLTVQPSAVTITGTAGGTATFTIYGGIPGYTITSSRPTMPPVPTTVAASGGTFTVTVPASTAAGTVTITVRDSAGTTATATITII